MIAVGLQPEYAAFNADVRQKGQRFLRRFPSPTSRQFARHDYWRTALAELRAAYSGRCAYTSRYLVYTGSIDHFRPKSKYPHLAYEWDNYRFCRQVMNTRKGDSEDVMDPFRIQDGWFTLDMPSCLVRPEPALSWPTRKRVNMTINTLGLNSDDRLVGERCQWLVDLADGEITLQYVERHYPFLAREVERQQVYSSLKQIFARP